MALVGVILLLWQAKVVDERVAPLHIVPQTVPTQDYNGRGYDRPDMVVPQVRYISQDGHKLS